MNVNWQILIAAMGEAAINFLEIAVIAYAIARSRSRRGEDWRSSEKLIVNLTASI